MTTASFAGVDLDDVVPGAIITDVSRQLLGARRTNFTDVPGVAGSWVFGDEPGDRTLTLSLHIVGDDFEERREAVRDLAAWADSVNAADLIVDDEPDRYERAILASAPEVTEQVTFAQVELEFRCGPYAFATAATTDSWTATSGVARTFSVPDGVNAQPILQLTAGGTSIPSTTVLCNGQTLTYGTQIPAAGVVTISSLAYVVTNVANTDTDLTGAFPVANVSMAAVDGTFPTLVPGTNSITVTTSNGQAMTAALRWRRRYR
jgi:predicted phage tail component-like protein